MMLNGTYYERRKTVNSCWLEQIQNNARLLLDNFENSAIHVEKKYLITCRMPIMCSLYYALPHIKII